MSGKSWEYACATCGRKMRNFEGEVIFRSVGTVILKEYYGDYLEKSFDITDSKERPKEGQICFGCSGKAQKSGGKEISTDAMFCLEHEEEQVPQTIPGFTVHGRR